MADTPSFRIASDPAETGGRGARTESLIDRESHFSGTYRTPHDLRIEGQYEGEIECRGTVFVGETANVNARIVAGNVTIAGHYEGEIMCDTRFEILRSGRVSGSVSAAITVVHEGAFYQGELRMTRPNDEQRRRQLGQLAPAPLVRAAEARPPAPAPAPAQAVEPSTPPQPRPAATPPERTPPAPPRRRAAEPSAEGNEPEMPASLAVSAGARTNANGNGRGPDMRGAESGS